MDVAQDTLVDGEAVVDTLTKEIGSWPGVQTADHRFGGVEFLAGRREIGHVHALPAGRSFADLPFPKKVRDELIETGRARPHHVLPDSGWLTVPIRIDADLRAAIEIFRMNFERSWTR
jgi:hypothetical protein